MGGGERAEGVVVMPVQVDVAVDEAGQDELARCVNVVVSRRQVSLRPDGDDLLAGNGDGTLVHLGRSDNLTAYDDGIHVVGGHELPPVFLNAPPFRRKPESRSLFRKNFLDSRFSGNDGLKCRNDDYILKHALRVQAEQVLAGGFVMHVMPLRMLGNHVYVLEPPLYRIGLENRAGAAQRVGRVHHLG